ASRSTRCGRNVSSKGWTTSPARCNTGRRSKRSRPRTARSGRGFTRDRDSAPGKNGDAHNSSGKLGRTQFVLVRHPWKIGTHTIFLVRHPEEKIVCVPISEVRPVSEARDCVDVV